MSQHASSVITESYRLHPGGSVTSPEGFRAAAMAAGLKPSGAADLALLYSVRPSVAAGVFTQSLLAAAPVRFCRAQLAKADKVAQAVLINSGQANAATGSQGDRDAEVSAAVVAQHLGIAPSAVLLASTGVIGHRIPMDLLIGAVPKLAEQVTRPDTATDGGLRAALAIMTTDLVPKHVAGEAIMPGGQRVRVGAMAKGSGMIHPNMATMLAFVTTDGQLASHTWQQLLRDAANRTFNQITVDGDTSTNDTLLGLANGAAGVCIPDDRHSPEYLLLEQLLTAVLEHCAKAIARDGEGATVLLEVRVAGARSDEDARKLARCVASSSLCKAAVFGHDPNWGRVAAALGRAGVPFDPMALDIALGPFRLMAKGQPVSYDAVAASRYLAEAAAAGKQPETYGTSADTVVFDVRVGNGPGTGIAWGCDLSYDYVRINAEYTT
jgi:glutamate N-acetyltransferase/amino-acid N-acetyltransferase